MTFKNDFHASGSRASHGGGRIAAGGGIGSIVIVGLYLLLGGNPTDLINSSGGGGHDQANREECKSGADANKYDHCRVEYTGISLDRVWSKILPEQANIDYTKPGLTLFSGATSTGCGQASSSTGPFYCPADSTAYFDTSFFQQLKDMGGSNGPFAQEYVVAHEFGHHIQNLQGTLGLSDYNNPGEDSNAVKMELQADCYAGIWANHAAQGDDAILEPLSDDQVQQAVTTAQAIGDDAIQKQSGQSVNPDQWTHGSSEERKSSFLKGYKSGTMSACKQSFNE